MASFSKVVAGQLRSPAQAVRRPANATGVAAAHGQRTCAFRTLSARLISRTPIRIMAMKCSYVHGSPRPFRALSETSTVSASSIMAGTFRSSSSDHTATPPRSLTVTSGTSKAAMASLSADFAAKFRGAMPKDVTGASRFLAAHPEADGRGTVVAIFDTGVDPGAAGLQVTTTGQPKVIDVVDCTGSGDVDTSMVVEAAGDGETIQAASGDGQTLRINKAWKNPTGKWHVGYRRAYNLFPGGLVSTMKSERAKAWAAGQREAVSAATAALAEFTRANPKPATEALKKEKSELEARVKLLGDLETARTDLGPLIHCVVWHDGEVWRAALDTSDFHQGDATGALSSFEPLTDFATEHKYGTFSAMDACNFALNIYDDGKTLSIVVDAGSHGTHVAGITAAYHPDDPNLNGVAPGAQIISCKIGDTRLGSIETGVGLTRALIHTIKAKADLINMSYGEATTSPNAGRFMDLAAEVVNKHGVIFVSSAGNSGPALSTVGAPGGTSSTILSIGAYVSPDLAAAGHSVREVERDGQQYTWSSRGPAMDGDLGVTLSAPGGAIAPVPVWTRQRRQLMNGTSMASPNACGCVALLLSGLKAENIEYTPATIRRGLENTCQSVRPGQPDNHLTHGRGLIQVDKAWKALVASNEVDLPSFMYQVKCRVAGGLGWDRGVYLREPGTADGPVNVTVDATPFMHEDADVASDRMSIEHKLLLKASAPWINCPDVLLVHHNGRTFEMTLDCSALAPGLHYAEVEGIDSSAPWRGPLFRVPITVVKPDSVGAAQPASYGTPAAPHFTYDQPGLQFVAGREHRRFVAVPEGSTWCEMRLKAGPEQANPIGYFVRATQLRPAQRFSDGEGARSYLQLASGQEWRHNFSVNGGGTLEVTLAQFWSSLGDSALDCQLEFHGVSVSAGSVLLNPGGPTQIEARAPFRRESVNPKATLTAVRSIVRPSESALDALATARDTLPGNRAMYCLTLTYKVSGLELGSYSPDLPGLYNLVYDASYEVTPLMMFDGNKQLLCSSDPVYPSKLPLKKKIEYTLRVGIRHDNAELLEKLRAVPLHLDRVLDSAVTVPVYASNNAAVTGGKTTEGGVLQAGAAMPLFLGPVPDDKLPKDCAAGKLLVGKLTLGRVHSSGSTAPGSVAVALPCPPAKEAEKAGDTKGEDNGKDERSESDKLSEAVRDAKVKFLTDMKTEDAEARKLYESTRAELHKAYPGHLPLLLDTMTRLDKVEGADRTDKLQEIVKAADAVVAAIDTTALAAHVARKCSDESPEGAAAKKDMEEQKSALVDALACKCKALLDAEPKASAGTDAEKGQSGKETADTPEDAFLAAFSDLRRWVDTAADSKHMMLHSRSEERAGRLAQAYQALNKLADPEDKVPPVDVYTRQTELLARLGWAHWEAFIKSKKVDMFPPSLPPM